jgi:putative nucleotidyltransferase with HDIG domain
MVMGVRAPRPRWRYRVGQVLLAARPRYSDEDVDAVLADLTPPLGRLWMELAPRDKAHSIRVFRQVASDDVLVRQAALLHDVGKARVPLGTVGRSLVVLGERFGLAGAVQAIPILGPRVRRYRRHPQVGAEMLELAGADPLLVEVVAEHQASRPRHPQTRRLQEVDGRE